MSSFSRYFSPFVICCLFVGAASGQAQPGSVTYLSLKRAIEIAVSPSAAPMQSAQDTVLASFNRLQSAKAETSFDVQAVIDARSLRIDLRALGINLPRYPLTNPIQFVGISGPFGVFDPEIKVLKVLIDKHAKSKTSVAKAGISEAESSSREEREIIAAGAARKYFNVLRASGRVQLEKDNLEMSELLLRFAEERLTQGTAFARETRGARAELNSQRLKLSEAMLEQTRELMQLMYLLGIGFGEAVEFSDSLEKHEITVTLDDAIAYALKYNPKLTTFGMHDKVLALTGAEIRAESLPVFSASGNVGSNIIAPNPSSDALVSRSFTYTGTLELSFPIFGRHQRALEQSDLALQIHEQSIRERQLRRQVELDTRLAYASLENASKQLSLAEDNLELAELDLKEAVEQRAAGNISHIEVQRSENRRALAADTRMAALFLQAQARLALAEIEGRVLSMDW